MCTWRGHDEHDSVRQRSTRGPGGSSSRVKRNARRNRLCVKGMPARIDARTSEKEAYSVMSNREWDDQESREVGSAFRGCNGSGFIAHRHCAQ